MYLTAALLALDVPRTLLVMTPPNHYADLWDAYASEVRRPRPSEGITRKKPTDSDREDDPDSHPDFDVDEWSGFHIDGDKRYQER